MLKSADTVMDAVLKLSHAVVGVQSAEHPDFVVLISEARVPISFVKVVPADCRAVMSNID